MIINDDYLSSNYNLVQEIQIVKIVLPESSFYVEKPNQMSLITLKEFALEITFKHLNVENISEPLENINIKSIYDIKI